MKLRVVGACAVAAVIVALGGCTSSARDAPTRADRVGSVRSAVQGGDVDQQHSFAVGVCGLAAGPGQCQFICSGTIIAPNLVLTARHCVEASPSPVDCPTSQFNGPLYTSPTQYYVTTSYQLYQPTQGWHRVADIRVPPSAKLCGSDLSLLILADDVAASEATPATPAVQYPLTDRSHYPSLAQTAIGYGVSAPGTDTAGTRRVRSHIAIQCIPGDPQAGCDPLQVFGGDAKEYLASDGTCDGDSGSSGLEQTGFQNNTFVALGVLSRGGVSTDGTTCIDGIYTRLDVWRDWIVATALDAAKAGGYAPPAWTVSVAVPDAGSDADAAPGAASSSGGCAIAPPRHDAADARASSAWALVMLSALGGAARRLKSRTKRNK